MKKGLLIFCAVLLVIGSLCSCGGPAETESKTTASGTDLQGRTIKIMYNGWDVPDLTDEKGSFAQTAKKFNCKFEFEEFSDEIAAYNGLVMSYLSGTAEYDALTMRGYNVAPGYAASGVLLKMSDYYDFDQDETWQNELVADVGVWRDARYGLAMGPKETGYAIWYNKRYLREANIPDLWEYIENDTWNFDTFRSVVKQLTKTENGETSRYGFYCEDIVSCFILANGGTFIDTTGDKAVLKIDSAESLDAMQYVMDLYNVDKSVPTNAALEEMGSPNVLDMFSNGTLAMTAYGVWAGPAFQNAGIDPADLGWIYYPKGDNADDYVVPGVTPPKTMVVPALVERPEEVVAALADALGFWGENKEFPKDMESYYDDVVNNDQMLDILVGNNKKCYLEGAAKTKYTNLLNYEGILDIYGEMVQKLLDNESTPKAAVDSYFARIQSKIDVIENGINLDDYQ